MRLSAPRWLILPLSLALALLATWAASWYWQTAHGESAPVFACDLDQRPCRATLPSGATVTLEITPRPVSAMKPLAVRLTLTGFSASEAGIEFYGAEMDMGRHRFPLSALTPQEFSGAVVLPLCVTRAMRWRATVRLLSPAASQATLTYAFVINSNLR